MTAGKGKEQVAVVERQGDIIFFVIGSDAVVLGSVRRATMPLHLPDYARTIS